VISLYTFSPKKEMESVDNSKEIDTLGIYSLCAPQKKKQTAALLKQKSKKRFYTFCFIPDFLKLFFKSSFIIIQRFRKSSEQTAGKSIIQ